LGRIVEAHGGEVDVGNPSAGAEFVITLLRFGQINGFTCSFRLCGSAQATTQTDTEPGEAGRQFALEFSHIFRIRSISPSLSSSV
jgi:hypothetical protein